MIAQGISAPSSSTAALPARTTKCVNCAAPLEITPDAVGYVCEYCGWTGLVDGIDRRGYLIVKPLSREANRKAAFEFLRKRLKRSFSETQVREEKFLAIPFWVTRVEAWSQINGYSTRSKTETYTVSVSNPGGGSHTETRTNVYQVYVPVKEKLYGRFDFAHCARKNASFYGLDELRERVRRAETQPLEPLPLLKERMEFLDVEIDEGEEREWAETAAEEEQYKKGRGQTSELFDCRTETTVRDPRLVYYPIHQIDFEVRGKVFRATFDGTSGRVVKAEFPVSGFTRVLYAAAAYVMVAAGALVGVSQPQVDPIVLGIGGVLAGLSGLLVYQATLAQTTRRR